MKTESSPRLLAAERLSAGVIITFDDGKCALYSSTLLHAMFPQAEPIPDEDEEDLS